MPSDKRAQSAGILAAASGLALSAYAYVHQTNVAVLGRTDFPCNINQYFSCDRVALSEYSRLFDVPQGFWGVVFFGISLLAVVVPSLFRRSSRLPWVALMVFGAIGSLYCLRLFMITIFRIEGLCVTCFAAHLSCYTLLFVATTRAQRASLPPLSELFALTCMGLLAVGGLAIYPRISPLLLHGLEAIEPALSDGLLRGLTTPTAGQSETARPWNPIVGPVDAPRVLVEFVDYTCPACGSFKALVERYNKSSPVQLKVILKNFPQDAACNRAFPTSQHPNACLAAYAAQCAQQNGVFKEFFEVIFETSSFAPIDASKILIKLGMSDAIATDCLASDQVRRAVASDIQEGIENGVNSTPGLIARGRLYQGPVSLPILKQFLGSM